MPYQRSQVTVAVALVALLSAASCHLLVGVEKKDLPERDAGRDTGAEEEDVPSEGERRCSMDNECDDGHVCTEDLCNISTGECIRLMKANNELCRPAAGWCDLAEYCDGVNSHCPPDKLKPPTEVCREAAGQCDEAEYCTGISPECGEDLLKAAGEACDDGDLCTYGDRCDGRGTCVGSRGLHDAVAVSAGAQGLHVCSLLRSGEVRCWGANDSGQAGRAFISGLLLPATVGGLGPDPVVQVSAGGLHTCAVLESGRIRCWGFNATGQLGDGTREGGHSPRQVESIELRGERVSAGSHHTCAVLRPGGLYCWGAGGHGQLGDGLAMDSTVPVKVQGGITWTGNTWPTSISAGGRHTCAVTISGEVYCWGAGDRGQIGNGGTTDQLEPVKVPATASSGVVVSAGDSHTCALTVDGKAYCWGSNEAGQLGQESQGDYPDPVEVLLPLEAGRPTWISAGLAHTCVVMDSGKVFCWGGNADGQLGDGTTVSSATPVEVGALPSPASQVVAGSDFSCALLDEWGLVYCWGAGARGQLGGGTAQGSLTPSAVLCE